MPSSGRRSLIPFTDLNALPRPNSGEIMYILHTPEGLSTGQPFIWSDTDSNYRHVGEREFEVVGTWSANQNSGTTPNGTPDYSSGLTTDGNAWSVSEAGDVNVNGFNQWNIGDLIVRDNGIYFRIPRGAATLSGLEDGDIPVFENGLLVGSRLAQVGEDVIAEGKLDVDSGTLAVGPVEISERGGFVQTHTDTLDREYINVDYRVDDAQGSRKPNWFPRSPRVNGVEVQPVHDTVLDVSQNYTMSITSDSDIAAIELFFVQEYTNLKATIKSQLTNKPIKWWPSRAHVMNDDQNSQRFIPGETVSAGAQKLNIGTKLAALTLMGGVIIEFNQPIQLRGNSSNEFYLKVDELPILEARDLLDDADIDDTATDAEHILSAQEIDRRIRVATEDDNAFDAPRITNLRINIPSRVDVGTDLNNTYNVTFNAMHVANLDSLRLEVTTGDDVTLTVPVSDGDNLVQGVTLTNVITLAQGTVTFRIIGQDNRDPSRAIVPSNTVTIQVRNLAPHEFIYHGLSSSNNPADVVTSGLTQVEAVSGDTNLQTGPATQGDFYIVLVPASLTVTTIEDTVLDNPVYVDGGSGNIFTKTSDVRIINSEQYDSYALGPLVADFDESYVITIG